MERGPVLRVLKTGEFTGDHIAFDLSDREVAGHVFVAMQFGVAPHEIDRAVVTPGSPRREHVVGFGLQQRPRGPDDTCAGNDGTAAGFTGRERD
jgi:hypothetical protein